MKQLIILRHAKAAPQDQSGDHKRPLARRGHEQAPLIARKLVELGLQPELVFVSTALRTRETYDLVAPIAGLKPAEFADDIYLASSQVLLRRLKKVPQRTSSVMLIGHNPGVADLVQMLSDPAESDASALKQVHTKFPTAACAVLDVLTPWSELQDGDCGLKAFFTPATLGGGVDED